MPDATLGYEASRGVLWLQRQRVVRPGKFQKFDYGPAENIRRYAQEEPPQYELNKVTSLVSIIYSDGDIISTTQDVEALYSSLPATFSKVLVGGGTFKHFDAVVGREARLLVHQEVVKLLQLVGDSDTPLFDLNSDTTDIVIINFLPEMSEEEFDED
uniref:Uncharacterized protein n=1 Tax=Timema poppense TaxID=170557 RepID=A0A7R9H9Z7_TIMPO|nr:unnamed protein product [Timema poppensis]